MTQATDGDLRRQLGIVRAALDRVAEALSRGEAGDGVYESVAEFAAQAARMAELAELAQPVAAAAPAPAGRGRVLLVDDEPLAVDCITEYLDGHGYDVLPAGAPRDALALASRRKVDLVVTDLRMPGMDGGQLVAELRKTRPGLPAVVVTGHLGTGLASHLTDGSGGPVVVMRKPLALDRLEAAIAGLLAGRAPDPAP